MGLLHGQARSKDHRQQFFYKNQTGSNKSNKLKYNLQINLHCAFIGQNRDGDIVNFEKKTNTFEIKMYHFRGCGFYNYNFTIA